MTQRIKSAIYSIILFLSKKQFSSRNKKILIVKTDEIGDYLLWRNFASYYKTSPRFEGYKITLCGNKAWKNLYEAFDSSCFDEVIWLDKQLFKSNMPYRYRFLKKINSEKFEIVINTIYSRCLRIDDSIVIAANAKTNIGMPANDNNVLSFERGYDKNLYQFLADLPIENLFDFYRNKLFTAFATSQTIPGTPLTFDKAQIERRSTLPENYFVVFPGSNKPDRIWQSSNFKLVAEHIHKNYGFHIVICGAESDLKYAESLTQVLKIPFTDLCGKTNLKEFLEVLAYAKGILSIDTGSVHLAATVQCPVFGIFNGSQYGRFAPYPPEIFKNFFSIYSDAVEMDISNSNFEKYRYLSPVNYDEVSAKKVIDSINIFYENRTRVIIPIV